MKNPQSSTFNIVINNAQLAHIVDALQSNLDKQVDLEFDRTDTFYVSAADTLDMLKDLQDNFENDADRTLHGLCL